MLKNKIIVLAIFSIWLQTCDASERKDSSQEELVNVQMLWRLSSTPEVKKMMELRKSLELLKQPKIVDGIIQQPTVEQQQRYAQLYQEYTKLMKEDKTAQKRHDTARALIASYTSDGDVGLLGGNFGGGSRYVTVSVKRFTCGKYKQFPMTVYYLEGYCGFNLSSKFTDRLQILHTTGESAIQSSYICA